MPERIEFKNEWVRDVAPPAAGRKTYYDTVSTSLVLIVTAKGAKSFYRAGRPSRVFIGHPNQGWTVALARQKCNLIVGEIAAGKNPVEDRRKKKKERTLRDAWEWYLQEYSKVNKRTWHKDELRWKTLEDWADRKLSSITRADFVSRLNRLIAERGENSARTEMALLNSIFSQCVKNQWLDHSPGKGVTLPKTKQRKRFLQSHELPNFFHHLASHPQVFQDFINIAIYTAARKGNVEAMQFSEIHKGVWTIPAEKAKGKKPIRIPLMPALQQIIARRRKAIPKECDWVFPSDVSTTGHMAQFRADWRELRKSAGLKDFHMHDLRHVLPTWAIGNGVSLEIIGEMLGHADLNATKIYATIDMDPVRKAIESGADAIKKAMASEKSKEFRK